MTFLDDSIPSQYNRAVAFPLSGKDLEFLLCGVLLVFMLVISKLTLCFLETLLLVSVAIVGSQSVS